MNAPPRSSGATALGLILLLGGLPGFLPSPLAAAGGAEPPGIGMDTVDVVVRAFLDRDRIPGAAVAILEEGRLVKVRGYGLADVEHSVPVHAETLFQSGSVGKPFTAAAVLLLAEEGRLSLEDPITRHLAEAPSEWDDVTIRHLLGHTSGLGAYEPRVDLRRDYTDEELVAEIAGAERLFEPGAEWSYSNSGYVLLGILVSRVTGEHWGATLGERVFRPAGMETAQVISEAAVIPHRASGYVLRNGVLENQAWVSPTFLSTGDGALYFSILDLVRWDQAFRGEGILSEGSRRAMWSQAGLNDGSRVGYGLGWGVTVAPGRPHVSHGGSWQGFKAFLLRFEDPAVTVALLTNGAQADPREMAFAIAEAHRPELSLPRPRTLSLSNPELEAYAGAYRLPGGRRVEIRVREGALEVEGMGAGEARFEPLGEDTFLHAREGDRLRFVREGGAVVAAWLGPPGAPTSRLRRVESSREKARARTGRSRGVRPGSPPSVPGGTRLVPLAGCEVVPGGRRGDDVRRTGRRATATLGGPHAPLTSHPDPDPGPGGVPAPRDRVGARRGPRRGGGG